MKTELVEELLERTDYDNMSEEELRYLKDHNKLPVEEEARRFRAAPGLGGPTPTVLDDDVPNPGDVDTRNHGIPQELRGADLSMVDPVAAKDAEIERLKQQLAEAENQRDAALTSSRDSVEDDDDDDDELVDYSEMKLEELHTEIDARNDERATAGLEPLSKPRSKAESVAELERDDTERPDEGE